MGKLTVKKKYILPAVVSAFLPGVGQLLKGHVWKAVGIWVISTVIAVLFSWWFWIPGAIVWLGVVIDALVSENKDDLF